ncbi:MAG TPA: nickel transporter [Microvirga sp.]|nr:nickel transporter [Microvirga sp.]
MTAATLAPPLPGPRRLGTRLALAAAAVACVAGIVALLVLALAAPAAPPVKAPFGLGMREAAPAPGGLGGVILSLQAEFYRGLQRAVLALKTSGAALWTLLGLGFAYGVFHAAGPGHGKAVIAAYLVANERALLKGFGLSLAAAAVQAIVAVAIVGIAAVVMQATAAGVNRVTAGIEGASFLAVALVGAWLTWRKAGHVLGVAALARNPLAGPQAPDCGHVHLPPPDALDRVTRWRELAGIVLAAGIRPCSGAVVVLVFCLSQGLLAAGIAATVAMALGTALTTGAIAALAVFAKGLALRLAGGRGGGGALAVAGLELLAAAFVFVLGLSLLSGMGASPAG